MSKTTRIKKRVIADKRRGRHDQRRQWKDEEEYRHSSAIALHAHAASHRCACGTLVRGGGSDNDNGICGGEGCTTTKALRKQRLERRRAYYSVEVHSRFWNIRYAIVIDTFY